MEVKLRPHQHVTKRPTGNCTLREDTTTRSGESCSNATAIESQSHLSPLIVLVPAPPRASPRKTIASVLHGNC
jgi:hypothetical protein